MSTRKLPKWARLALFDCRPVAAAFGGARDPARIKQHKEMWRRVSHRQLNIEQAVLTSFTPLSENGKRVVFQRAVGAALDAENLLVGIRQAKCSADTLSENVLENIANATESLAQLEEIGASFGIAANLPTLWDALEQAASKYRDWAVVSDLDAFLRIARTQSRPAPSFKDVAAAWVVLANQQPQNEPPHHLQKAVSSRQTKSKSGDDGDADVIRLFTSALTENFCHPGVPSDFKLPDASIAEIIDALMDWPRESTSHDAVRGARRRLTQNVAE